MQIQRIGSQPSQPGVAERYTGQVRVDPLAGEARDPSRTTATLVTFEPGARTRWHVHPLGQLLMVTSGCGLVQGQGGPAQEIRPGDVVWIEPGERHWHGAAPLTAMAHVAVQEQLDGGTATWLEPVPDEVYLAGR